MSDNEQNTQKSPFNHSICAILGLDKTSSEAHSQREEDENHEEPQKYGKTIA